MLMILGAASSNTPTYIGFGIGFAVIVVVVALVARLLTLASAIAKQAGDALESLELVRENTALLPAVQTTNEHAVAILQAAQTARRVLTG
jgi:hypothetical protein